MPYCPKCDMEFINGITVCSDCGGPLVESAETAKALKEQEMRERQEEQDFLQDGWSADPAAAPADQIDNPGFSYGSNIYKKKSQKYEDLKSSASAFLMVGVLLLVFSLLCWLKIINLPLADSSRLLFQTVLTIMGIGSAALFISSSKTAKGMASQIEEENKNTEELITWFTATYTAKMIDQRINDDELSREEVTLKRYDVIQDLLITHKDLPDQSFVDLIAEEIYEKIFEI